MGQVQSVFDPDKKNNSPVGYLTPPFPSLYNPSIDSTIQQRGYFLHDAEAIWRFTFYWTLILLMGTFIACALLAMLNLLLSRTVFSAHPKSTPDVSESGLFPRSRSRAAQRRDPSGTQATISSAHTTTRLNPNGHNGRTSMGTTRSACASEDLSRYLQRKRPPLWYLIFIPLGMGAVAAFVALVSGTIVGFALAAVYAAAGFSMSTWVPFMWGMIQVVVLIISSYSSLTRVL